MKISEPEYVQAGGWTDVIADELESVEAVLQSAVESSVPRLLQASNNLLEGGGKRLRPSLVLLWAKACGGMRNMGSTTSIAAAAELIHMATLMHDDVIDESDLRRGRRTANASWGNKFSVLTGDFVLSRAFEIIVRHGDMQMMRILAGATTGMAESEALQAVNEGDIEGWRSNYWGIIKGKTADFMSACCQVGAYLADATLEQRQVAADFGTDFGLAFQITDDLLDLVGDADILGKPLGNDLRDGKVTLPVLLTLDACAQEERERLSELIASRKLSGADIDHIRRLAEPTVAIQETRLLASKYAALAVESLSALPDSPAKIALRALADQVALREG